MSSIPSISIIVPAYENPSEVDRCLTSLNKSELRHESEIIIIDDCSPKHGDEIKEIAQKYAADIYRQEENAGPGVARNRGVKEARGSILVFIDSDCVAPPGWLSRLVRPIRDKIKLSTTSCYSGPVTPDWITTFQDEDYRYRMPSEECEISFVNSCNFAIDKKIFNELGGFPAQRISEDMVLGMMLADKGMPTWFLPDAGVMHGYYDSVRSYLKQRGAFAFNTVKSSLNRDRSGTKKADGGVRSFNPLRTAAGMFFISIAIVSFVCAGIALLLKPEFTVFLIYCGMTTLLLETTVHGKFLFFLTKRQGLFRAASYMFLLYLIDFTYVAAVLKALLKSGGR